MSLLGELPIPQAVLERLVASAGGNPLFAREMVAMLVDDGLLRRDSDGWVIAGDLSELPIPPGIHALLAARLDTLVPDQRSVLERGSVIGQVFYRGAVKELSPAPLRPQVDDGLKHLEETDFIRSEPAGFDGEDAFRFRHLLIRDAAYEGMLKRTRAGLHEAFAGWLQSRVGEGTPEYQEILGYHLEQAYKYLTELGPPDEHAQGLATVAAGHLLAAGNRARARGDAPAAANLLGRADGLWQGVDRERVVLLIELSEAREELADRTGAESAMGKAEEVAAASGDAISRDYALIGRLLLRAATDPDGAEVVRSEIDRMRPRFEEAEDYRGLARLWGLERSLSWGRLQMAASEVALGNMIQYSELAGDERRRVYGVALLASCSWIGPTRVEEALPRCQSLLIEIRGNRVIESEVRLAQAVLHAMNGEFELARELYRTGLAMVEEMGLVMYAAGAAQSAYTVEMMAENPGLPSAS